MNEREKSASDSASLWSRRMRGQMDDFRGEGRRRESVKKREKKEGTHQRLNSFFNL